MTFFTGKLQEKLRVLAVYGWEVFEKIPKGVTSGEVIEQGLGFHPGSFENQSATEYPRIGLNRAMVQRDHGGN
jgi:hypothetical protein